MHQVVALYEEILGELEPGVARVLAWFVSEGLSREIRPNARAATTGLACSLGKPIARQIHQIPAVVDEVVVYELGHACMAMAH